MRRDDKRTRRRFCAAFWRRAVAAALLASLCLFLNGVAGAREYSEDPFNASRKKIDPEFGGCNPVDLVAALETDVFAISGAKLPVDPKERADRLESLWRTAFGKPLFGDLTFGSRLAVALFNESEVDDPGEESVTVEYRRESRTMTVSRSFKTPQAELSVWVPGTFPPLAVYFSLMNSADETYALAVTSKQFRKREPPKLESWILVDVDEERYESLRDSVRVLCVFTIAEDGDDYLGVYTPKQNRYYDPLTGSSYGVSLRDRPFKLIVADEVEFWVYDGATGEILAKFSAPDALNGRRVAIGKSPSGSVAEKRDSRSSRPPRPSKRGKR